MLVTNPTSPEFNSYASVKDLETFVTKRGISHPDNAEALLIKAMDFLSGITWKGRRAKAGQPLAWPRSGIYFDGFSYPNDVIPPQLITAQCMLAIEAQKGDLQEASRSAPIKSERVEGAVTTVFAIADGEAFKQTYPAVMALLNGLVVSGGFAINAIATRT
ncbi:DnaT-like ssDNA-binding protein [Serratia aquatilis]|uniref:DnaT-like ssDNA-binding protein n=1 Tax=Serratia aquatilis TaxID=1737515 RepID=A0ABV6E9J9_9GAMM